NGTLPTVCSALATESTATPVFTSVSPTSRSTYSSYAVTPATATQATLHSRNPSWSARIVWASSVRGRIRGIAADDGSIGERWETRVPSGGGRPGELDRLEPLRPLDAAVRLVGVGRLACHGRAVPRGRLAHRIEQRLRVAARADHEHGAGPVAGADEDVPRAGRAVEVVPGAQRPL